MLYTKYHKYPGVLCDIRRRVRLELERAKKTARKLHGCNTLVEFVL
jgi:hypothetical protein